jgi:ADP-L-glycero-D-manno-heptose 6-epimerase
MKLARWENMRYLSIGRIVVTGGAGLIGSALINELNRRGFENILVTDLLDRTEKWKNLVALRYEDYLEADDFEKLLDDDRDLPADIHTVFHLGACSSTTETDAAYLVRNNFEYTKKLANWCMRRNARFIYASSAATYGGLETDLSETSDLQSLRPLNMYGYSKQMFDLWAQRHGYLSRLIGLKYFNVFGPNEDHKGDMRSVVNKAFYQIQATGKMQLFRSYRTEYADGCQRRDFLYVKDAVKMTVHLAELDAAGGLFNIGAGESRTWLDLAHALFAAMEREPNIEFIEMPENLRSKYQYSTCAVMDRFRATGYRTPVMTLEEAVSDYVGNYLALGRKLGDAD